MAWAFHNTGGLIVRGPSTKAQGEFDREDVAVYDILGNQSERIIPGYKYVIGWKDMYSTYGDFTGFTTNILGTYGFVGELFQSQSETYSLNEDLKKPGDRDRESGQEDTNHQRLKFNDNVVQGAGVVYAGLARHAFQIPGSCSLVNKETTSLFPVVSLTIR